MRVAFLAAECEPWAKTGGLADVVDALARALGQVGGAGRGGPLDGPVDVFLPRYRSVPVPASAVTRQLQVPDPRGSGVLTVGLVETETHGYRLRLVDHPPAFDREGLYGDAAGDYPDNAWRFGLFCRAALEALRTDPAPPDVLHLHDWHAAPAVLLRDGLLRSDRAIGAAAVLLTVHNLAYHGWPPAARVPDLGLGAGAVAPDADGLDLLAAGIERAELVNTVSPGFAAEARTPAYGMGLDEHLRAKGDRFFGILNGLDTDLWDPATDSALSAPYSRADRSGKASCRAALLTELGMDAGNSAPLLAMIGRLDPQKGFDLLSEAAPDLLELGFRLAVLGSGTADHVGPLRRLAAERGDRVALLERFDRDLARRLYAGADGFLMPSRFEPCGTGQMIALRYGTPPIVRATGGLRDTVVDAVTDPANGTGFWFEEPTAAALVQACDRFMDWFAPGAPRWEGLLDRGMAVDFDWRTRSAPAYLEAYRRTIEIRSLR
ncbi:MAG: glycogen synthase [Chloroflexi bacterium]|nr:glycogen synthase [Chloroflexota bacterium]